MQFLPAILTAVSLLLPGLGSEMGESFGLDSVSVRWAELSTHHLSLLIHSPADPPSPARLVFSALEEAALGEEESFEIDSLAAISAMDDPEINFPSLLLNPTAPRALHANPAPTFSVLRC